MRIATVGWLVILAAAVVWEFVMYYRVGYWGTATGRLVSVMLGNSWLFVIVPGVFVIVAFHLLADAIVIRLDK